MDGMKSRGIFYVLSQRYILRGWSNKPLVLIEENTGRQIPLTDRELTALKLTTSSVDLSLPVIPSELRDTALRLCEKEILYPSSVPVQLSEEQKLKTYPCQHFYSAVWSLTGRCNFRCKHCFLSAPGAKFGEPTTEECLSIISQLSDCGIRQISLTGGEALLRTDFYRLLDALSAHHIRVINIASNGLLVTEQLLDQLEDRGMHPAFYMSFDGVGWHDWLRGIDGAERMLMDRFTLLSRRGFKTGSAMTLHRRNLAVLRDSVNQLASVGCQHVITNRAIGLGEWEKNGSDLTLSVRELFDAYLEYIPQYYADKKPVKLTLNRFFEAAPGSDKYEIIPIKKCSDPDNTHLCSSTCHVLYLSSDSRIDPCSYISASESIHEKMPNVMEKGLLNSVRDQSYFDLAGATMADYFTHNPECAACEYRDQCLGGCRAQALTEQQEDYFAKDPASCLFFKAGYREKLRHMLAETAPGETEQ